MQLDQRRTRLSGFLGSLRRRRQAEEPLIQRGRGDGVNVSLVSHGGIRHAFAVASARPGNAVEAITMRTLGALTRAIERTGTAIEPLRLAVFIAEPTMIAPCLAAIRKHHGATMPVTDVIRQKPADGSPLSIELWGVVADGDDLEIERVGEQLVKVGHDGITTVHCSRVVSGAGDLPVHEQATAGFASLSTLLAGQKTDFDQVIRTWLYLGDIVGAEGETQRYKELNRARSELFSSCSFRANRSLSPTTAPAYPASTGIGSEGRDLTLSCIALASRRRDLQVIPLENPRQISAFDYAPEYSPQSPKFSRAMAVEVGTEAMILISGTASITQSETQHTDDARAQTRETLANIEALISEANLSRHGLPGFGAALHDMAVARVYIKRAEDYATVRAVCASRLGQVPVTYTLADVCRPQLLVEIEGIAFSRWACAQ